MAFFHEFCKMGGVIFIWTKLDKFIKSKSNQNKPKRKHFTQDLQKSVINNYTINI